MAKHSEGELKDIYDLPQYAPLRPRAVYDRRQIGAGEVVCGVTVKANGIAIYDVTKKAEDTEPYFAIMSDTGVEICLDRGADEYEVLMRLPARSR